MTNILFESPRLLLQKIEQKDLHLLLQLFCDQEMMKYLGNVWPLDQVQETLNEWHSEWGNNHYYYGTIVHKDSQESIGIAGCSLNSIQDEEGLELSWFILPKFQGKGYASEITEAFVAFAFTKMGITRVLAETHSQNPAANRVLEKTGFTCLGERNHQYDYLPEFTTQVLWERRKDG